jgi:hypothetical protein
MKFDSTTGEIVGIEVGDFGRWSTEYPSVNLQREVKRAGTWLLNNPRRRPRNVAQFLSNWLNRARADAAAHGNGRQNGAVDPRRINAAWAGQPTGEVTL